MEQFRFYDKEIELTYVNDDDFVDGKVSVKRTGNMPNDMATAIVLAIAEAIK